MEFRLVFVTTVYIFPSVLMARNLDDGVRPFARQFGYITVKAIIDE